MRTYFPLTRETISERWTARIAAALFLLVVLPGIALPATVLLEGPLLFKGAVLVVPFAIGLAVWLPSLTAFALFTLGVSLLFCCVQQYMLPVRLLDLAVAWFALFLGIRNRRNMLECTASVQGRLFCLFPLLALASIIVPCFAEAAQAYTATGWQGFSRLLAGSTAATPLYALSACLRLALYAVFVLALAAEKSDRLFKALFSGVAAGTVLSAVAGLPPYILSGGVRNAMEGRFSSFTPNPGWYSQYACLAFPFLVWGIRRRTQSRMLIWILAACFSVVMAVTMTRAAWLVAGALMLIEGFWPGNGRPSRQGAFGTIAKGLGMAGVVLAAGVLAYAFFASGSKKVADEVLAEKMADRVVNFTKSPRMDIIVGALAIGAEHPFTGFGYETYALRYRQLTHSPGRLAEMIPADAQAYEATHNFYLQLFTGLGLIGLAAWLALAGFCAVRLWRGARSGDGFARAALLALAAFHAFGLFQEMIYVAPIWLLGLALPGVALSRSAGSGARLGVWPMAVQLVLMATFGAQRPQPARVSAQMPQGLFPVEEIGGAAASWSVGTASFLLMGEGPWEVEVGAPGPLLSGSGVRTEIRSAKGTTLASTDLRAGAHASARLTIPASAAKAGDRVYLHADRVFFPLAMGSPDTRILGPYVKLGRLR